MLFRSVRTVSASVPFSSAIYGWADYESYGHPGCFFLGDVQPPQVAGTLPPLTFLVAGSNTGGDNGATVPPAPNTLTHTDNCSRELPAPVQSPRPGTFLGPGSYLLTLTVADASGNEAVTSAPLVVSTLPKLGGATNATIPEMAGYTQALVPSDPDLPPQTLTVSLLSGPPGLVLTNSVVAWTPTEAQGPSTNLVRVATSDGYGSVTNEFTLVVQDKIGRAHV